MPEKRKLLVFAALLAFMVMGMAAIHYTPPADRNLTVLPKDISDQKLDSIMQTYNKALGVKCDFCHVKKIFPVDSLDYASDKEPMKEEARKMMRMVIDINQKNFHYDKSVRPEYLKTVTCITCHRGEPFPPED